MLTFTFFSDNPHATAEVHIDPTAVPTVVPSERRRAGILVPVALVTLSTGQEFTVEDPGRDVAKRIREARQQRGEQT
jgi:hypothetical protein